MINDRLKQLRELMRKNNIDVYYGNKTEIFNNIFIENIKKTQGIF